MGTLNSCQVCLVLIGGWVRELKGTAMIGQGGPAS